MLQSPHKENRRSSRQEAHTDAPRTSVPVTVPPQALDAVDALHRVATALERIFDALASNKKVAATSADGLMSQDELAKRLGVSNRFVQRHITPSLRTGPRGKKFYRLRDVEEQLAASTIPEGDRSKSPQWTRSTRVIAKPSRAPREVSAEVGAVEAKLRASLDKPRRKSP